MTELLLCAEHWTRLLFFLFFKASRTFSSLRKIPTCFQMTTRTISEMITITNSTRTAAATVSSERRARGEREKQDGKCAWTHRRAGRQCGCDRDRNPRMSWRSMRAAWLILGMGNSISQLLIPTRLLELFPWKRKGQNSIRGMQYIL